MRNLFVLVLLPLNVWATTYYVNSNCAANCDGSTPSQGFVALTNAFRPSIVPGGSTVEVVAGSGPYYEYFAPSTTQDGITWNFNGTEIRGYYDVNQLVANGTHTWTASSHPSHTGEYYLKLATPSPVNLIYNGDMENGSGWSDYSTVSVNEISIVRKYAGTRSRHVVANVGGTSQAISGLTNGKKYRVSGRYYLVSGQLTIYFFSNQTNLTTTGSWQQFSYDITATGTSTSFIAYYNSSTEFYIDDVTIYELDGSNNPVLTSNPWPSTVSSQVSSVVVNGTWNAYTTKTWTTDRWDWGDFDSIGFNTLYVKWSGGNPTGQSVTILAPMVGYLANFAQGATGHVVNGAKFIGANTVSAYLHEAVTFNRCEFRYTDQHAIELGSVAVGSLANTSITNSKFIDCGHRGINIVASVNPVDIYNNYFYGCHLEARNYNINSSVVNFKNNASNMLLSGGLQWENTTSTFNENNNQFFINKDSQHGGKMISFYVSTTGPWTTTSATDIPASFSVTSPCSSAAPANCGNDPLTSTDGYPEYNSPLIDAGANLSITSDYDGNPIWGNPDIGAYEYQPPYTIGTNNLTAPSARIYQGDQEGRFRALAASTGACPLQITPSGGTWNDLNATDVRPVFGDVTGLSCTGKSRASFTFTPAASMSNPVVKFTGIPGRVYAVKVDGADAGSNIVGCQSSKCLADASGVVSFSWNGSLAVAKAFDIRQWVPSGGGLMKHPNE